MDDAALDAAAGHPDGEAERMMVAAVGAFGAGRAAELGGPHDERFVEQAALLEVVEQAGDRLVDLGAVGGVVAVQIRRGRPSRRRRRCRRGRSARSARRARPAAARPGSAWRTAAVVSLSRPYSFCVAAVSCWNSNTSGIARCMRNASSYDLMRASALASSGYSASASRLSRSSSSNSACLLFAEDALRRAAEGERVGRVGDERHAVVLGAEVVGAVRFLAAAAVGHGVAQHDELRQVLVERAQAVVDPGADRGEEAVERVAAGVELKLGAVVDVVGPHRADDGEVVDAAADVRPPVADFDAALRRACW